MVWVEQRFSAALKTWRRAASASEVPRGLKPNINRICMQA
jgi:hypothetical protein